MNKIAYWLRTGSNIKKKDKFPLKLSRKKVATFFTWIGLLHWFLLSIFAAASANYNNNLSIAFVCFLGALYFTGIITNYYLLKRTTVHSVFIDPTEQGSVFSLSVRINSKKNDPDIWLEIDGNARLFESVSGHLEASIPMISGDFGVFSAPIFSMHSLWPYGLNKAWIFLNPDVGFVVLPPDISEQSKGSSDHGLLAESLLAQAPHGDPDSVRPLAPFEQGKIAWKDSIRRQKWMTYTYTASSEKVVTVVWPEGSASPKEKMIGTKNILDLAVRDRQKFQIIHPLFSSKVLFGKQSEIEVLSEIALLEFEKQPWEKLTKSFVPEKSKKEEIL